MPRKFRVKRRAPKSAIKIAKKALNAVQRFKPEVKCYDNTLSAGGVGILPGGLMYRPTNALAQGNNQGERSGQTIHMTSLALRGIIASGNLGVPQQVRMIVLIDKEMDGVLPVASDVLQNVSGVTDFYSGYNTDNRGRFHILEDVVYSLNPGSSASFHINKYYKVGRVCQFGKLGTGLVADSFKNQPFVLFITDVAANNPSFGMESRLSYYDD